MKKLLFLFSLILFIFPSCQEKTKENINIYTDKNIIILIQNIAKTYEKKNENIKINISTEKPNSFEDLDIIISSDQNIFKIEEIIKEEETDRKKTAEDSKSKITDYQENFSENNIFATDNIVLVGRKKINELREILYSNISIPNYENIVGKIFADNLTKLNFIKDISQNIEYTQDTISALQSVDLYEVDYAIVNSLVLNNLKNAELCYSFDELKKDDEDLITYNSFLKNESSEQVTSFYNFLSGDIVKKMIEKTKTITE